MENSFRFCGFTVFRSERDYAVARGSLTNMMRALVLHCRTGGRFASADPRHRIVTGVTVEIRRLHSSTPANELVAAPAIRREIPRKLCFSLLRNNRLRLPGGSEPVCGRELHPLKSSATAHYYATKLGRSSSSA